MKLQLTRHFFGDTYTIGSLSIENMYFCDTLEDKVRATKIKGITAISAGTYKVIINHSQRFNKDMPLLLNVTEFDGIRIHSGNTDADTEGCILIGKNTIKGRLTESAKTFLQFMQKLEGATDISITIC